MDRIVSLQALKDK